MGYIERLIYDEIHKQYSSKNESPTQDDGHIFRMKLTKDDFETCFPNIEIDVDVDHEDNFPVKLTIDRRHKNKKDSNTKLIYKKYITLAPLFGVKVYQRTIDVEKQENGRIYIKTSSFTDPGKFVQIK